MKAPDKIFITEDFAKFTHLDKPVPNKQCVEYIRKDALLEWVSESEELRVHADRGEAWSIGYLCAMADLKDKLKSM